MFRKLDYAMVNVSEMGRSVAFYRDVLGFPVRFETPGWSELETGDTTIALHLSGPAPSRPSSEPFAGTCSLGFSVGDLDETVAALTKRGARFVVPVTDQKDEGIRLAVCLDPDGLPISFAQPLQ